MKIKQALAEKKMGTAELAEAVGVNQSTITRIINAQERLRRWGSPELLYEIAEILSPCVHINELLFPWKYFGNGTNPRKHNGPRR